MRAGEAREQYTAAGALEGVIVRNVTDCEAVRTGPSVRTGASSRGAPPTA